MAPIQIKCPGCAATLRLSKPPTPGKQVRCPKCSRIFSPPPPQGILEQSPPAVTKGSFRKDAPIPVVQPEAQPADFEFDVEPVVPRPRKRSEGGQAPSTASTIASSSDDRTMGMLCYLLGIFTSFIGPLIIWLMKKDQSRFVDYHGREVLNFIINLIIAWLMVVAVVMALSFVTFGIGAILILPLYLTMIVYSLVISIMGAMKANRGELYHIPMTIRIIPLPAGVSSHSAAPATHEESREVRAEDSPVQPSPWPKILLIGGGVAGLLMLTLCGGCGYWIYHTKRGVEKNLEEFQANFPKHEFDFPKGMDQGVNQPPGFIPPPAINEPLKALRPPANLDEALAAIQSGDTARQLLAANWLARANVDAARQPEIAKALERLLTDPNKNLQNAAMKALVIWATTENVPAIITVVENDEFSPQAIEARHLGMATLGRLKDERGVAPVAQRLSNIHDRSFASKALIAMGPIAETEVAKYLENNDIGTQRETCRILKAIGTKASIPALEVASRSKNRQVAATAKDALNTVKARGG